MGFSSTAQRPHISGYWWRLQSFVRRYPELTVEELHLYHVQEWVDGHNIARDATKLHPRCQAEHQMGPPPRLLNRVPQKLITTTSLMTHGQWILSVRPTHDTILRSRDVVRVCGSLRECGLPIAVAIRQHFNSLCHCGAPHLF